MQSNNAQRVLHGTLAVAVQGPCLLCLFERCCVNIGGVGGGSTKFPPAMRLNRMRFAGRESLCTQVHVSAQNCTKLHRTAACFTNGARVLKGL